jgi:hypothetical protein
MPLWGNKDNAANSDIAAVIQYNRASTSANQSALYKNVTANAFITNEIVGQFAVDTNEAQVNKDIPHSGWVLRKEGTGLRAGRITYEVLVATGSIATDGTDDTQFPDYRLTVTTQPTSNTKSTIGNLTFTVAATSTPSGASIKYYWQKYNGSSWANVANTGGQYFNNTSPTFTANNQTANGNVFRALVTATGANSVTSGSATILYVV